MIQLIYQDRLYMKGNITEIIKRLNEISLHHKTLREYINHKTAPFI